MLEPAWFRADIFGSGWSAEMDLPNANQSMGLLTIATEGCWSYQGMLSCNHKHRESVVSQKHLLLYLYISCAKRT